MTNPWVDAASRDFVSESSFNMDETRATAKQRRHERRRVPPEEVMGCGERTILATVKALHILDFLVGFSLLIYGLVISSSPATVAVVLVFLTSVNLLIRATLGLSALYTTFCQRYGLVMSAYLSPLFGSVLFISSMLCWAFHNKVFQYLENHAHQLRMPTRFVRYWARHSHVVWVSLLLLAVMEALRWLLERRLREQLLHADESFETVSVRSNHRPWWWRRNKNQQDNRSGELGDPLLSPGLNPHWSSLQGSSYEGQRGVVDLGQPEPKRGWLSRMFGRKQQQQEDISDVDFESVHEEWVSRSEEDPLWWSRDEEEGIVAQEEKEQQDTSSTAEEKTDSVSWVETTDV